jgi:hypothetical protein
MVSKGSDLRHLRSGGYMNVKTKSVLAALVDIVAVVAAPPMASAGSGGKHHQQFLLNSPEGSTTTTIAAAAGVFDGVSEDIVVDESFEEAGTAGLRSLPRMSSSSTRACCSSRLLAGVVRASMRRAAPAAARAGRPTTSPVAPAGLFDAADGRAKATFDFTFAGEKDANDNGIADPPNGVFFAKLTGTLTL